MHVQCKKKLKPLKKHHLICIVFPPACVLLRVKYPPCKQKNMCLMSLSWQVQTRQRAADGFAKAPDKLAFSIRPNNKRGSETQDLCGCVCFCLSSWEHQATPTGPPLIGWAVVKCVWQKKNSTAQPIGSLRDFHPPHVPKSHICGDVTRAFKLQNRKPSLNDFLKHNTPRKQMQKNL